MLKSKIKYILFLLYVVSMPSFSGGDELFNEPTLTPQEVLLIADKYYIEKGISIIEYDIREVTYDYVTQVWRIFCDKINGALGQHFTIKISDIKPSDIEIIGGA